MRFHASVLTVDSYMLKVASLKMGFAVKESGVSEGYLHYFTAIAPMYTQCSCIDCFILL